MRRTGEPERPLPNLAIAARSLPFFIPRTEIWPGLETECGAQRTAQTSQQLVLNRTSLPIVSPLQSCHRHNVPPASVEWLILNGRQGNDTWSRHPRDETKGCIPLLELLLHSQLRRVSTLSLAAVGGTGWQTSVALSADLTVTVCLGRQHLERGLDDSSTKTDGEASRVSMSFVGVLPTATLARPLPSSLLPLLAGQLKYSPEDQVQRALLLDVVVGQCASVLELLSGKD